MGNNWEVISRQVQLVWLHLALLCLLLGIVSEDASWAADCESKTRIVDLI